MFFALVVKKPDKGEFEITEEALKLAEDEEFFQQSGANPGEARNKKTRLLPPDQAKLIAMRAARMKERKMYSVIREVVTFYVFLALLLMIAYTHRDQMAFRQTKNLFNVIGGGDFSNVSIEGITFAQAVFWELNPKVGEREFKKWSGAIVVELSEMPFQRLLFEIFFYERPFSYNFIFLIGQL